LLLPYAPYLIWGGLDGATGSLFAAGSHQNVSSLVFFVLHQILPYAATAAVCAAAAAACLVLIGRRLPGRQATAAAFAWSTIAVLLFAPAVHSWYWLAPLALSLAAGLRVPIYLGLAAPAAEVGWLLGGWYRGWAHLLAYAPLLAGLRRRPSAGRPAQTVDKQPARHGSAL
jgi:hypothetical protein